MSLRCILYVRVSHKKQLETESPESQEARLRAWAVAHGHTVAAVIHENKSAKHIRNREGMQRALSMIRAGEADILVVTEQSRAFRNSREFENCREIWGEPGSFAAIRENTDLSTPAGRLHAKFMAAIAQYQNETFGQSMRFSLAKKREEGRKYCRRKYGYKDVNGMFVEDPQEQAAIKLMMALHSQGAGFSKIARELVSRKIPAPNGGRHWPHTSVKNVLERV